MVQEQDNHSSVVCRGSAAVWRRNGIDDGEHRRHFFINGGRGGLDSGSSGCCERRGEWRGDDATPIALLSNLGDALKYAANSFRSDVVVQTANARQQLLRFIHRKDVGGHGVPRSHHSSSTAFQVRRSSSHSRRRVLASISLSEPVGAGQSGTGDVHDAPQPSSINGGADVVLDPSPRRSSKQGWFSEVGQARAFYKQISVLDRAWIGAMAGGLAGGFTYCCLHPIDTVRTKLQTRGAAQVYKNGFEVVVSILKTKGVPGFYSGISAVLVGSILSSAVYFGCIELGRSALVKFTSVSPLLIPPLSGAFGNIVSSTILVPKEVITQRMQAGASGRSWHLVLRTLQNEGLRGLYVGYSAALVRNLPSSVISFTAFEYVKAVWLKYTGKGSLEPWQSVFSGAMAGAISGALTTPLDVVKTRLMTQAKKEIMGTVAEGTAAAELRAKLAASSYRGIASTLKQIWVDEGWLGLSKGMGPRLLHSAMFSALGYFAFETARVKLVKRHMAKLKRSETVTQTPAILL